MNSEQDLAKEIKAITDYIKVSQIINTIDRSKLNEKLNELDVYFPITLKEQLEQFENHIGPRYFEIAAKNPAFFQIVCNWDLRKRLLNCNIYIEAINSITDDKITLEEMMNYITQNDKMLCGVANSRGA